MIKLTEKVVEVAAVVEEKLVVTTNTEITIPIAMFNAMYSALPKVTFEMAQRGIADMITDAKSRKELLQVLETAIDYEKFYAKTREVVDAYRTMIDTKTWDSLGEKPII